MPMSVRLLRPRATGTVVVASDADARAYVLAVNATDGQPLEPAVQLAIDAFVVGCKADGIWSSIKASCILMGARTLTGALIPLAGTAPTSTGFASGDYNRKTGLIGNASTKWLNSNRNNNSDPQNNFHFAIYASATGQANSQVYLGAGAGTNEVGASNFGRGAAGGMFFRCRGGLTQPFVNPTGFIGASRSASASYVYRAASTDTSFTATSETPVNANVFVFATTNGNFPTNARLAFYSIGESLSLASLDSRVTTLYNAIGAAIP